MTPDEALAFWKRPLRTLTRATACGASAFAYETTNLGQLSKEQEAALLVLLKQAFYKYKQ